MAAAFLTFLKRLAACDRGNIAVGFALSAVVLIGLSGGVVDYVSMSSAKTSLQAVTDAAVLASAKELQLAGPQKLQTSRIEEIATILASTSILKNTTLTGIDAVVSTQNNTVSLKINASMRVKFLQLIGMNSIQPISATATARLFGGLPVCVLALDKTRANAIGSYKDAEVTATGCTVHANSSSSTAIEAWGKSVLNAGLICAVGGVAGGSGNFVTAPISDCPTFPDPLSGRQPPPVAACNFNNYAVSGQVLTLFPGVYCGGLKINGSSVITFAPGDYVIKDGPFEITFDSRVTGQDVAFFLTGANATLGFYGKSDIALKGRETGVMAGLLFFEDPSAPAGQTHTITTDYARILEGTIYLPKNGLQISTNKGGGAGPGVASQSAYTVIIANSLTLTAAPKLILNTDFGNSPVPVPPNITSMSGEISLIQ